MSLAAFGLIATECQDLKPSKTVSIISAQVKNLLNIFIFLLLRKVALLCYWLNYITGTLLMLAFVHADRSGLQLNHAETITSRTHLCK